MADVVRDVVIKIAIQQANAALKTPDLSVVENAVEESAKRQAETIQTAIQSAYSGGVGRSAGKAGADSAVAAFDASFGAKLDAALKLADELNDELDERAEKLAKSQAQLNSITADLRSAGEGAFRAARGVALWTAANDDSLHEMLKTIAAVQGAWDIFSGGLNAVRGIADVMKTAAAAGGLYAVVMTQVARAQAAVAATATLAGNAIKFAMGPVGIAIAVVAAAVYAGSTYWSAYAEETKAVAEAAKPLEMNLRRLREQLDGIAKAQSDIELSREIASLDNSLSATQRIALLDQQRLQIATAIADQEQRGNTLQSLKTTIVNGSKEESQKAFDILRSLQEMEKAGIDTEKQKLGIYKEQQEALRQNLEQQKSISQAAKEAADQERARVLGIQESLGRLDPLQKEELRRLSEKQRSGVPLTTEEAKRVGELGGGVGREFESRFFQQRGAGLEGLLTPFNGGVAVTGAGSRFDELLKKAKEEAQKTAELDAEVIKEIREIEVRRMQSMMELKTMLKDFFAERTEIERLKETVEEVKREMHDDKVHGGGRDL